MPTDPITIVLILGAAILLLLILGTPLKPIRFLGQGVVRILIGALFLFFLNTFGSLIGIHIPINVVTAAVSGFLGIPGLAALVAIQQFILV